MVAPEDSIREELIGAVLGELSLVRRDVDALKQLLEQNRNQIEDTGELTLLRFSARYEQFLTDFSSRSADVLAQASRFGDAREQLLGEIALRQYDETNGRSRQLLRDVLREEGWGARPELTRLELAVWAIGMALVSAALSAGALALLH